MVLGKYFELSQGSVLGLMVLFGMVFCATAYVGYRGLEVLVVILFLQTWRASIIPLVAVPVSLIGTFAVMHMFGFSLTRSPG